MKKPREWVMPIDGTELQQVSNWGLKCVQKPEMVQVREVSPEYDLAIQELISAAKQMHDAYVPSHSNKWMSEDGWGKSNRKDYRQDEATLHRLRDAILAVEGQ